MRPADRTFHPSKNLLQNFRPKNGLADNAAADLVRPEFVRPRFLIFHLKILRHSLQGLADAAAWLETTANQSRETAKALNVSVSTVKGDWRIARAWLKNRLSEENA